MNVNRFVDTRLLAFRDRTGMWGSNEAVELQAIQLLEFEARSISENVVDQNPRLVLDLYVNELGARFEGAGALPLHDMAASGGFDFGAALYDVCASVRSRLAQFLTVTVPDRLKVRLLSRTTNNGSLPLKTAVQMMAGLRSLLVSGARMEHEPAPSHLAARRRDTDFGDACRLGQTEVGSFIINIEMPSTAEAGNGPFAVAPTSDSSLSRRVTQRIMAGLCTVAEVHSPEQLVESYIHGMNANMLEAMVALQPEETGFELDISSRLDYSTQSAQRESPIVRVAAPHFDIMKEGARQLRALSEEREKPYRGRVRTLVSNTGQVNIDVDDGGRGHQLHAYLHPPDYRNAVRAHESGRDVIITGKITLHGAQRWIDEVFVFDVVEEKVE